MSLWPETYVDIDAGLRPGFELLFRGGYGRGRVLVIVWWRGRGLPRGHGGQTRIEKGIPV